MSTATPTLQHTRGPQDGQARDEAGSGSQSELCCSQSSHQSPVKGISGVAQNDAKARFWECLIFLVALCMWALHETIRSPSLAITITSVEVPPYEGY